MPTPGAQNALTFSARGPFGLRQASNETDCPARRASVLAGSRLVKGVFRAVTRRENTDAFLPQLLDGAGHSRHVISLLSETEPSDPTKGFGGSRCHAVRSGLRPLTPNRHTVECRRAVVHQFANRRWRIHASTSASTSCTASVSVFPRRKPNANGLADSARLEG